MKRRLFIKPEADRDINNQFTYIADDNLEAAIRFYEAAFASFNLLLANPFVGPARPFDSPQLMDIRLWFVTDFHKYLIFYRVTNEFVEIVRVLHSARDIDRIMVNEG